MLLVLAFSSTGFLVGIMTAFSSDHMARIVVPLFFALFGGSLVTFGQKLAPDQRKVAYLSLLSISASCAVGIVLGVLCVQYRWLSPRAEVQLGAGNPKATTGGSDTQNPPYLRGQTLKEIDSIQALVGQGFITKDKAYDKLVEQLRTDQSEKDEK